jgi:hypothetical protein
MTHLPSILQEIKDLHGLKAFEGPTFLGMLKDLCPDLEKPIYFVLKQAVVDQVPQRLLALRKEADALRTIEIERLRHSFVNDNCLGDRAFEVFDLLSDQYFPKPPVLSFCDYFETVNGVSFKMLAIKGGKMEFRFPGDVLFDGESYVVEEDKYNYECNDFFISETGVLHKLWNAVLGISDSNNLDESIDRYNEEDYNLFIDRLNSKTSLKYETAGFEETLYASEKRGVPMNPQGQYVNNSLAGGHLIFRPPI